MNKAKNKPANKAKSKPANKAKSKATNKAAPQKVPSGQNPQCEKDKAISAAPALPMSSNDVLKFVESLSSATYSEVKEAVITRFGEGEFQKNREDILRMLQLCNPHIPSLPPSPSPSASANVDQNGKT